jgi:hypothetical protein
MALISGTIPSLINGVSQQPATLRLPTQGEVQENGLSHIARGLEKRPCTEHISAISGMTSTNSDDVFIHTIRRSEDEAYALIMKGTTSSGTPEIKVIDLTGFATGTAGNEVYVRATADGVSGSSVPLSSTGTPATEMAVQKNYLNNFTAADPFTPHSLSATTIADYTFILNKKKIVKQKATMPDVRPYESLLYYKIGDFGANYQALITEWNVDDKGLKMTENTVVSGSVTKYAIKNQYKIIFATPDNETESRSGGGTLANSASINNQASVRVNNIANAMNTGLDASDLVKLVKDAGVSNYEIYVALATVADGTVKSNANEYGDASHPEENKGVKSKGVVTGSTVILDAEGNQIGTNDTPWTGGVGIGLSTALTGLTTSAGNERFKVVFDDKTSVIHIKNKQYPITVELTDGKGDTFSRAVNGSEEVPNFGYLPGSANIEEGFVARISGDKASGQDDYYVTWNGSVWKETVQPIYPGGDELSVFTTTYALKTSPTAPLAALKKSQYTELDGGTMPLQLFKAFDSSNVIYFVLQPVEWATRKAGDATTNPFPAFAGYDPADSAQADGIYTINDIFFHRNRLGFISDENVILSEAGGYFNFFHATVLSVLDTAVIDVAVSNNQVAILKSAIPFQESLILFSDLQQFKLSSDSFLTPTSVTVDVATNFETSTTAKPVPAGKTIFFPFQRGAFSGIREYFINIASETNDANEITAHVPEYVEGTVRKLAVSSNEEVLLVLSDTDRRQVKVYKYYYNEKEKLQSSWSSWKFDAEIIDMSFVGSVAFFLFRRGTTIYLEKLNLSVDNATDIMDDKIGVRLDRRVKLDGSSSSTNAITDFYSDVNHDAVIVSGSVQMNGTQFGPLLKIKGLNNGTYNSVKSLNQQQIPKVGQRFTSAAISGDLTTNTGVVYTVVSSISTINNQADITVTPSVASPGWPDNTVLTFEDRKIVYVVETGQEILESKVLSVLTLGTQFSQGKLNTTPVIFAGTPYDFRYQFSQQFVKNNDNSINSGRLQLRNIEVAYANTGAFQVEVAPRPYDSLYRQVNVRHFTGKVVGTSLLGVMSLETGVLRIPVYCNSKDARITVSSKDWHPVALQSADWEALQVLRSQRI